MTDNHSFAIDNIGHAMFANIDITKHILKRVIFIDTHYIESGFSFFLYRHSHHNSQMVLIDGRSIRSKIICFLKECEKIALKTF